MRKVHVSSNFKLRPARLLLGCALLPMAASSWAQAQANPGSTVQVIGTRAPTALNRVVADVVVIDRDRIRATSADSLEDLLRREGGIQLSRNGGPGQNASVLIRGSGAEQHAGADRRRARRLGHARPDRPGGHQPGPGGAHRDHARPRLQPVRRRRHRRRGQHRHPPRRRRALCQRQHRRRQPRLGRGLRGRQRLGEPASTMRSALSGETSDGVSALLPGDLFGMLQPRRRRLHALWPVAGRRLQLAARASASA